MTASDRPAPRHRWDISTDELRRHVRAGQAEHHQSLSNMREAVARLGESDHGDSAEADAGVLAGGLHRRRFLQIGGATVMSSVLLAACTKTSPNGSAINPGTGSTSTTAVPPDVGVLRLASSLEHYAVGLYMTAVGSGLVKTTAIGDAAKYFSDQHADHASSNESATVAAGGQPFTTANAAVAAQLKPRVDALQNDADIVKLAYDVESVVAATYLSAIGGFTNPKLNSAAAAIMAVEARHVAVLGMILSGLPSPLATVPVRIDSRPFLAGGFQTKDGAIPPGTGV